MKNKIYALSKILIVCLLLCNSSFAQTTTEQKEEVDEVAIVYSEQMPDVTFTTIQGTITQNQEELEATQTYECLYNNVRATAIFTTTDNKKVLISFYNDIQKLKNKKGTYKLKGYYTNVSNECTNKKVSVFFVVKIL